MLFFCSVSYLLLSFCYFFHWHTDSLLPTINNNIYSVHIVLSTVDTSFCFCRPSFLDSRAEYRVIIKVQWHWFVLILALNIIANSAKQDKLHHTLTLSNSDCFTCIAALWNGYFEINKLGYLAEGWTNTKHTTKYSTMSQKKPFIFILTFTSHLFSLKHFKINLHFDFIQLNYNEIRIILPIDAHSSLCFN